MIFLESPSLAVSNPEINKLGLSLSPINVSLYCRRNLDHKRVVSRRVAEAYWGWHVLLIRAYHAPGTAGLAGSGGGSTERLMGP